MYIVEFERSRQDGKDMTRVLLLDPTADECQDKIITETVYTGDPPGLTFQTGVDFAVVKLQRTGRIAE